MQVIKKIQRVLWMIGVAFALLSGSATYTMGELSDFTRQGMNAALDQATLQALMVLTPTFVSLIPDALIAYEQPELARVRRQQFEQVIKAGLDLYTLALAVESGSLSADFKEQLNTMRDELKDLNTKLGDKSKELSQLIKDLRSAPESQKPVLMERQALVMLEMSDMMATPLYSLSLLFAKLNEQVVSKLVRALEAIPQVKPYLLVGQEPEAVPLSRFMQQRLGDMVSYTKTQSTIGKNLSVVIDNLKASVEACHQELTRERATHEGAVGQSIPIPAVP